MSPSLQVRNVAILKDGQQQSHQGIFDTKKMKESKKKKKLSMVSRFFGLGGGSGIGESSMASSSPPPHTILPIQESSTRKMVVERSNWSSKLNDAAITSSLTVGTSMSRSSSLSSLSNYGNTTKPGKVVKIKFDSSNTIKANKEKGDDFDLAAELSYEDETILRMKRQIRKLQKMNEWLGDHMIDLEDQLQVKSNKEQQLQQEILALLQEKDQLEDQVSAAAGTSSSNVFVLNKNSTLSTTTELATDSDISSNEEDTGGLDANSHVTSPSIIRKKKKVMLKKGLSFHTVMDTVYKEGPEEQAHLLTPEARTIVTKRAYQVCPGLLSGSLLVQKLDVVLTSDKVGYNNETTLLATSLCCDEVNRELESLLRGLYGHNFSMGGLAGFAFGGITSFGAMAHHIPLNGNCLIVYGPHVGIDLDGNVGKLNRIGRSTCGSGPCCGSAAAAHNYCKMVSTGERDKAEDYPTDFVDAQQHWVGSALLPHAERLNEANIPEVELPHALFDCQHELMMRIVQKACGEVGGNGKIALLGGIQVNTPNGISEYFLPRNFQLFDNKGNMLMDLMEDLKSA